MSASTHVRSLFDALQNSFASVPDPGASGTIRVDLKGYSTCEVVTAAAESRALEDASLLPIGLKLVVNLKTDGGDLTITSDDADVVLTAAGQAAEFVVVASGSDRVWKLVKVFSRASAGTYEFQSAGTITAAQVVTGILAILANLEAAGLIDDSGITQAS